MNENIKEYVLSIGRKSKDAFKIISKATTKQKNYALSLISKYLDENKDYIIEENKKDIEFTRSKGRQEALVDRVTLNDKRINGIIESINTIILLDDPVGKVVYSSRRPNGLVVNKIKVPIGTILMIYEARPNVTVDAASLILKSGNAGILRGGSEAYYSNIAIMNLISNALEKSDLPRETIQYVDKKEHEVVNELLKLSEYIDVVIPRGSENLIKSVTENAKMPVLRQEKGVCHVYIDKTACKEMAERITINAKTQRPSVCNAAETLLIHKDYPYKKELLLSLIKSNVRLKGCKKTLEILPEIEEAKDEDYYKEYLDYIMNVKIVDSIEEAINHISKYGSGHTETIVTRDYFEANKFLSEVDSSTVMVNASTRFTDGGEFGLGAEIGISTHKFHARGPMGLMELTTDKWLVYGEGQIRE
ncbi:MAG: glutamate-5-semialdehyde dehydrogenase [Brevinematia bacterium]